ncbi:MAG: ComEA family DNA-binding protein [Bacteroidales bacterium]
MKIILQFSLFIFALSDLSLFARTNGDSEPADPRIVIMQETGEITDSLPVMRVVPDTAVLYSSVIRSIHNSFLDRFLDLFMLCQKYLVLEGALQETGPAYLALTDHQGGFAREGFILKTPDGEFNKQGIPYVDITVQSATRDIAGLMSVTQLFPHEMAHVMYRMLSPEDSLANNSWSVDMHYFSLTTDYPTAFNEGFAEHMENVARHFEKNESIREGIANDLQRIEKSSSRSIEGFTRDFRYPLRVGYYKAGMINWYQKYEDYKRSEHALSGKVRYKNRNLQLRDAEDGLTYRNAGVGVRNELRNIVQFHATEGAVSAFFTALSLREDVRPGISDSLFSWFCGEAEPELDHLEKQFLKYFFVLHHYVVRNNSNTSQFADFIGGYLESFPEDRKDVLRLYTQLTGQPFTRDLPPSLWLMVRDHSHRLLVLDPFGAIEVPTYTFNLNAAEVEDLLTVRGLSRTEAEAIIRYRERTGFFEQFSDLRKVPGLTRERADMVGDLALDQTGFDHLMESYEPELSISSLLITPLLHIGFRALLYFALIFLLILYLLRKRGALTPKKLIGVSLRYLFLWIGMVLLELAVLFLWPGSWSLALLPVIIVFIPALILYRGNRERLTFTSYIVLLMLLISFFSVV